MEESKDFELTLLVTRDFVFNDKIHSEQPSECLINGLVSPSGLGAYKLEDREAK